jgi:acylphosphatase
VRAEITVQGVVQGVGFRFFVIAKARGLRLRGNVRNLVNGNVSVTAEGEKGLINDLIKELKIGPAGSEVTAVDVKWSEEETGLNGFGLG